MANEVKLSEMETRVFALEKQVVEQKLRIDELTRQYQQFQMAYRTIYEQLRQGNG